MCLSKIQYPPTGKRCGKFEHMSKEEKQAHTDYINKQRREVYKENVKLNKLMSESEKAFIAELKSIDDNASRTDIRIVKNILSENNSNLAQSEVLFAMENNEDTLNSVYVLRLADKSRGYYKPFIDDDLDTIENYGIRTAQMMSNEVAAHKLSQALGGNFENLVPETDMREYNGTVGTIQREVKKAYNPEDIESIHDIEPTHLKAAAIYDYVAGSLDRHLQNFIIDSDKNLNLIDNGLCFPEDLGAQVHASEIADLAFFSDEGSLEITETDVEPLRKLLSSENSLGMDKYLTRKSLIGLRKRAQYVVDNFAVEDHFGNIPESL